MKVHSCTYIPVSALGLASWVFEALADTSLTWGDANRTLYTPERLADAIESIDDQKVLTNTIAEIRALSETVEYIDMEN